MINVIDSECKFAALEQTWRRLDARVTLRLPQTFDWCYTAWITHLSKEPGAKLWILHWESGKGDDVIFPFYIDRTKTLRFIMDSHNDINDVVCMPNKNLHMAFYEASEAISKNDQIKSVWFMYIYGAGTVLNYFGVLLPARIIYRDHAFSWIDYCPGDGFIARQSHLKSKDKANLKALLRKSAGSDLEVYSKATGYEYPRELIVSMRDKMLKGAGRRLNFFPDTMVDFCERIYNLGLCKLLVLKKNEAVVAFNFIECMRDRELSWIFMYVDPHASTEMYIKYFNEEKESPVSIFDFGVGAYRYKLGTFRPYLGVTFSMRYGKTIFRQMQAFKCMMFRALKDYIKLWIKPESH